jgi:hypothetical protein
VSPEIIMKHSTLFLSVPALATALCLAACTVSSDPATAGAGGQTPATVTGAPEAPTSLDVAATIAVDSALRVYTFETSGGTTYRADVGATYLLVEVTIQNGAKGRPLNIAPTGFSAELAGGLAYRAESAVPNTATYCSSEMVLVAGGKHTCTLLFEVPKAGTPVRLHYYEVGLTAAEGAPRMAVAPLPAEVAPDTSPGTTEVCGMPVGNRSESCESCLVQRCCSEFAACGKDAGCREAFAKLAACTTESCSQAVFDDLSSTSRAYVQSVANCTGSVCRSACEAQ